MGLLSDTRPHSDASPGSSVLALLEYDDALVVAARYRAKDRTLPPLEDCRETEIKAALALPAAGYQGTAAYPDVPSQAAAMIYSLAKGHPCVDGNKRYALGLALAFLEVNGWRLDAREPQLSREIRRAAASKPKDHSSVKRKLADWIGGHIQRIGPEDL